MVEACAIDLRAPSSIVQFLPDQFSNTSMYTVVVLEYKLKLAAPIAKTAFYVLLLLFGHLFLNTV